MERSPRLVSFKRMLVVPLLLVVAAISAGGAISHAQQSHTTSVLAGIAPAIEVVAWPDTELELGDVQPGVEVTSEPLTLRVRANAPWSVWIASDSPSGTMREYRVESDIYAGSGIATNNPVRWSLTPEGAGTPLSSAPTPIVTNADPTGEAGGELTFYLRFLPSFGDVPLADSNARYRIQIEYTVGLGY